MTRPSLFLKPGRERSVRHRHPWIFSGAIDRLQGDPQAGDTVDVLDSRGEWLARGGFSPRSQITCRIWTWDQGIEIDTGFFQSAILQSFHYREPLSTYSNAIRRINAENDGLPGLIVDQYGNYLVAQFLTAGIEKWKPVIVETLARMPGISGVYERSDPDVRSKEGLPICQGILSGSEPPEMVTIREGSWRFLVDIRAGHKTGFYLDQRDSRLALSRLVSQYLPGGKVLNCFSYTGAFAVVSISSGAASVLNIDSSAAVLNQITNQFRTNGIPPESVLQRAGNVFEVLREFRDRGETFDLVILDPPKMIQARKDEGKAARAYKDINWLAARIIRPGGFLMTFSCSGLLSEELFQKIIYSAMLDAGRDAQIIQRCSQPADHPVRLTFPEGRYLSGLICRIL